MRDKTLWMTYNGIGIALFAALTLCLQVPVFENYYLCLGYAVMMVYCSRFGGTSGALVGSLGVVVYCLVTSGLRGMPGWVLGNILIGLVMGVGFATARRIHSPLAAGALLTLLCVVSAALGILGVKSLTESLLYSQPLPLRMTKNSYAFVADAVMMAVSLPLCRMFGLKKAAAGSRADVYGAKWR